MKQKYLPATFISVNKMIHLLLSLILLQSNLFVDSTSNQFFADNGLQQTVAYKFLEKKQRQHLQEDILDVLGLDHIPKPRLHSNDAAPNFLLDLYRNVLDEESGLVKGDINLTNSVTAPSSVFLEGEKLTINSLRAINDSDKIMSFGNQHNGHHRKLLFDVSSETNPDDQVLDAELRMFRKLSESLYPVNWTYIVTIYQAVPSKSPGKERILKRLDSRKISMMDEGWLLFNATRALVNWISNPEENRGLVVRVRTTDLCELFLV